MTVLLIISIFCVFVAYWFTRLADQKVKEDSLVAYKTMGLAIIAGFIGYLALAMTAFLIYIGK